MVIPNYEILEKKAESQQSVIYKAYHKKNQTGCCHSKF